MGDYDFANELIEQCTRELQEIENTIAATQERLSKDRVRLSNEIDRKAQIELAMSQLKVHAPSSWCHFCKRDCPKPWDHLSKCNKYIEEEDE